MVRPGDWDAAPPLAPIVNGEKVKAPYNQQQFGGTAGGPIARDKAFFFGSYERRRERSEVPVTAVEAPGVVKTPADEHQGHAKVDLRFSEKNSLGVRYNMVRWKKDNESGGINLPGTGFLWDNNVDTIHGTFTTVISPAMLNEVRGQYSRYTDRRAAKCDCVSIQRTNYSTAGGYDQGTWGVLPEETYDLSTTLSLWSGNHTMKTGASFTYDVTEQLFQPLQNGRYSFAGGPESAFPTPFQYTQSFALTPEARLMFPKAYVLAGFFQDDWRIRNNLTINLGLRYDVEIIKDIPDWPAGTDADNLDPRVGFAWDPKGDQKWAVRGGFGRFTQQHPIFTIVKGGVGGRNGQVTIVLAPTDPLFPVYPNPLPAFPPGAVLPPRSIQEISPDLENERAWTASIGFQRQLGTRTSIAVDANINRGIKHGFLDMNAPVPIPKDQLNAALAGNPNATVRTLAQADATRPIVPVPNGFRHMELLTNEGRSWYQGVRFSVLHRTTPLVLTASYTRSKAEDRLNHWFAPENSTDPESDRGPTGADTPHNLVASASWNLPGSGPLLSGWRLSAVSHHQSGAPYTIRYAGDPVGYGTGLGAACNSRGCQNSTPEGRNTARGMFINYADLTLGKRFPIGADHLEVRADFFNIFNNQNLLAGGYVNTVGNVRFGQHNGGSNVLPGRQFQFATTYRF
jgi:hypothetical protein